MDLAEVGPNCRPPAATYILVTRKLILHEKAGDVTTVAYPVHGLSYPRRGEHQYQAGVPSIYTGGCPISMQAHPRTRWG